MATKVRKEFLNFKLHIQNKNLSINEQYILEVLFQFHNYDCGYAYPTVELLMSLANTTSKNRITKIIKSLEEKQLITVERKAREANRYLIHEVENFITVLEAKKPVQDKKEEEKTGNSENKPSVDSNGDLPLDGQIHYTEVESENTSESDNVKMVLDKYPNIKLSQKQKEVINSTEKDTLEFALDGIFVDEINGTYLLGAIERAKASENKVIVFPSDEAEKRRTKYIPFVDDCSSRPNIEEYYNSIEDRLLGWK